VPIDTRRTGTVIVLNWQGEQWLDACLSSLLNQDNAPPYRVLVVDNGSTDGSLDVIERYPVDLVRVASNVGFSRGNNIGARNAGGNWLIFANNDMRFAPSFVATVTSELGTRADAFAIDVEQRNWDGARSHGATRVRTPPLRLFSRLEFDETFPTSPTEVPFGNGGALCVDRDKFLSIGGFDERMFAGSDDLELCWRAWVHGWSTTFVPRALADAKIGGASSTPEGKRIRRRSVLLGRLVFATKHLPAASAAGEWVRVLLRGLRSPSLLPAVAAAARAVPALLRERRGLYRVTTVRDHLRAMAALNGDGE
jgi:GT2 family glycosyltransferase